MRQEARCLEMAPGEREALDRYRRFPVRFFLIDFLAFFAATLFFGTAFTFRERLVWVGLSLSSAANSSTPISEPVAATLARAGGDRSSGGTLRLAKTL